MSMHESGGGLRQNKQALADPRGTRLPPGVQILSFSYRFRQKKLQNTATLGVGAPSEKSLIRHWQAQWFIW